MVGFHGGDTQRLAKQTAKDYGAPMQVLQKQASTAIIWLPYMVRIIPCFYSLRLGVSLQTVIPLGQTGETGDNTDRFPRAAPTKTCKNARLMPLRRPVIASSFSELRPTKAAVMRSYGFCAKITRRWFGHYSQIFLLIKLQSGNRRSTRAHTRTRTRGHGCNN